MAKKTELPAEVIEALRKDISDISHGTIVIQIVDSTVVGAEVSKRRKFTKQ